LVLLNFWQSTAWSLFPSSQEFDMGYKVFEFDMMRDKYGPRKGLEGPFNFLGRVLYYDPVEGKYYDPRTDFYVEQEEMDTLNKNLMNLLTTS
jgi:hypothetical protein